MESKKPKISEIKEQKPKPKQVLKDFSYIKDSKTGQIKYVFDPDISGRDFLGKGQFGQVFRGYLYNPETHSITD